MQLQLLPDYVFEGARIRRNLIVCSLILLVVTAATLWKVINLQKRVDNMREQREAAQAFKTQIDEIDSRIQGVRNEIKPFDDKREYMTTLKDYGKNWPRLMREVSRYISPRVELLSAQLTEQGVDLTARTKSTDDVADMLRRLKAGYDDGLFRANSISVTGLTGWPNPTSPQWSLDPMGHIELPLYVRGVSPVNSNSRGGGGGGGGIGSLGGGGGGGSSDFSAGPPGGGEMGMEAPMDAGPPSGGSGMGGPPGGGGGGTSIGSADFSEIFQSEEVSRAVRGIVLGIPGAARAEYIKESDDPPDQPYLNFRISAQWQTPLTPPDGGGAQPGFAGEFGMMEGMPGMEDMSAMEGPPADMGAEGMPPPGGP